MPITIRLDPATTARLDRFAARNGQSRSEVLRRALNRLLDDEALEPSFYDDIEHLVGSIDTGGESLSDRTGERFRSLVEARRARGAG